MKIDKCNNIKPLMGADMTKDKQADKNNNEGK